MGKHKTNTQLIERIKRKFGTVQHFIEQSGLDERTVRLNLYRDSPGARRVQDHIARLVRETPAGGFLLTDADRDNIRLAIYRDYHNVAGFVREHPGFTDSYVSYLIAGGIKYRKGKADRLMKILNL